MVRRELYGSISACGFSVDSYNNAVVSMDICANTSVNFKPKPSLINSAFVGE
jgi:hypothetical protein